MIRPRVSIGRMMVVIAVAACGCGVVRLFVDHWDRLLGGPAAGVIVSAALIALLFSRGPVLRFAGGFLVGACLATVGLFAALFLPALTLCLNAYLTAAFRVLHPQAISPSRYLMFSLESIVPDPRFFYVKMSRPIVEAVIGVPILIVSLAGGLLPILFRQRDRSNPAPDPTPT